MKLAAVVMVNKVINNNGYPNEKLPSLEMFRKFISKQNQWQCSLFTGKYVRRAAFLPRASW